MNVMLAFCVSMVPEGSRIYLELWFTSVCEAGEHEEEWSANSLAYLISRTLIRFFLILLRRHFPAEKLLLDGITYYHS